MEYFEKIAYTKIIFFICMYMTYIPWKKILQAWKTSQEVFNWNKTSQFLLYGLAKELQS